MRIGIIAGEASGDILAAGLISAIHEYYPDAQFIGIAGPLMIAAGCQAIYPAEKLAVMGFVEVLAHYRELSKIRQQLISYFLNEPPDVFIGVDAPDFNLGVERQLKAAGIPTIHYVSPSVWAWRQYRLVNISKAVDLMLTLFPFEAQFYKNHNIRVNYVGHTLADQINLHLDIQNARQIIALKIPSNHLVIAVLAGSRMSEVSRLAKPFIETMLLCLKQKQNLVFTIPFINHKTRDFFTQELALQTADNPSVQNKFIIFEGQSREVMAASNAVLLASGTAALEALLLKKPMLVAYKLSPITYWIAKKLLQVPYYSLPNLLANEYLVEEITQHAVCAENMAPKVLSLLSDKHWNTTLQKFNKIHLLLRKNANQCAAQAVCEYLQNSNN
jgi:lipid-A-disaccharide synthase